MAIEDPRNSYWITRVSEGAIRARDRGRWYRGLGIQQLWNGESMADGPWREASIVRAEDR